MNINLVTSFLARLVVLLVAIPIHESAHGLTAYWLGDPTAKDAGRITLNPMRHIDIIGTLCLLIGGIGWARPVPVDARYFGKPKRDMALSALAGPVSNLLMAILAIILFKVYLLLVPSSGALVMGDLMIPNNYPFASIIAMVLYYLVIINIALAIFNMLPVPPFDGSRIFLTFLPTKIYFGIMRYERFIMIGLFILLATGVLDTPLGFLYNGVFSLFDWATAWIK